MDSRLQTGGKGTRRRRRRAERNKISIFKGVRLQFCAARLIWGLFFVAQHFALLVQQALLVARSRLVSDWRIIGPARLGDPLSALA
jgi:hypothetical protein